MGPGSHCHPVMNGASARRNTLFVLEVSVRLKGILHKPNQGVCAYVTRLARTCEAPSSSHCPEWEQSSFEDLTHKLSAAPPSLRLCQLPTHALIQIPAHRRWACAIVKGLFPSGTTV